MMKKSNSSLFFPLFSICLVSVSCGPQPRQEVLQPEAPIRSARRNGAMGEWIVGAYCPKLAKGRGGVLPILGSSPDIDLETTVESGGVRQFSVLGWNGKAAGVFDIVASTRSNGRTVAVGGYVGHGACQTRGNAIESWKVDPECVRVLGECGVAVAKVEKASGFNARPFGESPEPITFARATGCFDEETLFVSDSAEGFFARFALDGTAWPPDELIGKPTSHAGEVSCSHDFGFGSSPVSLLGVVDLDADGQQEILLTKKRDGGSDWFLYGLRSNGRRIELLGQGVFPKP